MEKEQVPIVINNLDKDYYEQNSNQVREVKVRIADNGS